MVVIHPHRGAIVTIKDWAQLLVAASVSSGIITGLYVIYSWAASR